MKQENANHFKTCGEDNRDYLAQQGNDVTYAAIHHTIANFKIAIRSKLFYVFDEKNAIVKTKFDVCKTGEIDLKDIHEN